MAARRSSPPAAASVEAGCLLVQVRLWTRVPTSLPPLPRGGSRVEARPPLASPINGPFFSRPKNSRRGQAFGLELPLAFGFSLRNFGSAVSDKSSPPAETKRETCDVIIAVWIRPRRIHTDHPANPMLRYSLIVALALSARVAAQEDAAAEVRKSNLARPPTSPPPPASSVHSSSSTARANCGTHRRAGRW